MSKFCQWKKLIFHPVPSPPKFTTYSVWWVQQWLYSFYKLSSLMCMQKFWFALQAHRFLLLWLVGIFILLPGLINGWFPASWTAYTAIWTRSGHISHNSHVDIIYEPVFLLVCFNLVFLATHLKGGSLHLEQPMLLYGPGWVIMLRLSC